MGKFKTKHLEKAIEILQNRPEKVPKAKTVTHSMTLKNKMNFTKIIYK